MGTSVQNISKIEPMLQKLSNLSWNFWIDPRTCTAHTVQCGFLSADSLDILFSVVMSLLAA